MRVLKDEKCYRCVSLPVEIEGMGRSVRERGEKKENGNKNERDKKKIIIKVLLSGIFDPKKLWEYRKKVKKEIKRK